MLIQWDPYSEIYVVSVPELPGCMTHGKTYEEAVQQGQDALASNEPVPPPSVAA